MYGDLHIHSCYSDGTMTPMEIVEAALQAKVSLLAIADHNALEGSRELTSLCANAGLSCLSAVELDSLHRTVDYHILGYNVDLEDTSFRNFVAHSRYCLDQMSVHLIAAMESAGEPVSLAAYINYNMPKNGGGWKALHYLMECGITQQLHEGFRCYDRYHITYGKAGFPNVEEVCQAIHRAGGYAVLAHPGKVIRNVSMSHFRAKVEDLLALGLDGIECYYPAHSDAVTKTCLAICQDHGLFITAGSDCHGDFQTTRIGETQTPLALLQLRS